MGRIPDGQLEKRECRKSSLFHVSRMEGRWCSVRLRVNLSDTGTEGLWERTETKALDLRLEGQRNVYLHRRKLTGSRKIKHK